MTATKVHVTWKQMIIHKNLYGGGGDSGAFRDELPVLWIAAVCAWKRYVYQRYRDKDVMHMMFDMKTIRVQEQWKVFEKLYGTGRAAVQL